jgi:hypothetical protein
MNTARGIRAFSATVVISLATIVAAQPQAVQSESSPAQRPAQQTRPVAEHAAAQIVYNVRSRESAEALHAQTKSAGDVSLPIEPNMPLSLQLSRSNANGEAAAAARATQAVPAQPRIVPRVRKQKALSAGRVMIPPGQTRQTVPPANAGHGRGKHGPKD